jgi:hypothetical protein
VRDHLRILKLPEATQAKVATGDVPLRAVRGLELLAGIHPGLVATAVGEVMNPSDEYEPYTWADVEKDALSVALQAGDLPEGVHQAHGEHPIASFTLSDEGHKELAELEKVIDVPLTTVRFGADELRHCRRRRKRQPRRGSQ